MATEHAETPDQLGAARVDPRSLSDVVNMPHVKWMPGAVLLDSIDVKEGAPLVDGYKLGKFLGAGVQARVFEIVRADDSQTGMVIKVAHADIGHKILNSPVIWIPMEREWETGVQMRAALGVPGGGVPGFLRIDDCVAVRDSGGRARFVGMVMERLVGWEVHKRLLSPGFHNIHYVREMLEQVFAALDRAQRAVGFHHADLGMRNIMENYPEEYGSDERPGGFVPGMRLPDGEMVPKGPRIEFKIIDYGVAAFNKTLARSAGGSRYRRTFARVRNYLAAARVTYPSPGRAAAELGAQGAIEMLTADSAVGKATHSWYLLPTSLGRRYLVKQTPKGAVPAASEQEASLRETDLYGISDAVSVSATSVEESSASGDEVISGCLGFKSPRSSKIKRDNPQINPDIVGEGRMRKNNMSAVERAYRSFWRRKGDAFHILLSCGMALDSHVWPKSDEELVQRFMDLVFHVTGVRMKASFSSASDECVYGSLYDVEEIPETRDAGSNKRRERRAFGKRPLWYSHCRRFHMIMKAHLHPYNSGLLASECLVSPFFLESEPRSLHPNSCQVPVTRLFPALAGNIS